MIFYKYILGLFVLLSVNMISYAQEQIMPLSRNLNLPIIPNNSSSNKTTATTPLNLPFFDDFSYAYKSVYPSASNWLDSNTYVNTGFAIAPITLGVATFDGLNKKGYPYNINASVNSSSSADKLTSKPINLQVTTTHTYSPVDSIFLTFYYQAEGFGEAPEAADSLCVDFFKPNQNKWQKVWGVKGYNPSATDTGFYRVRVGIADTAYCDSLFQFRFRNNATTSGSLDHWNIDFVQIKKNYAIDDTTADNVVFAYKPSSFLKNYSVIPYRQYNQSLEMGLKFRNYIRNNYIGNKQGNYDYKVRDALNNLVPTDPQLPIPFPGVLPFLNNGYYSSVDPINAATPVFTLQPFPVAFSDPTYFTITHRFIQSQDTNILVHVQQFSNYYAYDDGSAEQGYYLNTFGAKVAVRFTLNVLDTLKSVRVYFDPVVEGPTILNSTFRLMVWNSTGSGPGTVVYKDSTKNPIYISGCNNLIPIYNLTSCLPLNVGTYYIGIQQTTNQPLNVGFDKNTNHKDALYYNISGNWVQSAVPGSIMINPVMGCAINTPIVDCNTPTVGITEYEKNDKIKVFPNPAQNAITVSYTGNQLENTTVEIMNSLGQSIYTKSIISNESIDISELSNGLYFIHLKGSNLNVSPTKLIIAR